MAIPYPSQAVIYAAAVALGVTSIPLQHCSCSTAMGTAGTLCVLSPQNQMAQRGSLNSPLNGTLLYAQEGAELKCGVQTKEGMDF